MGKVYIVGVGDDGAAGLPSRALQIIQSAEILLGGERLLAFFPGVPAQKFPIGANLDEVAEAIKSYLGRKRIVVLASGDPNFYGIAQYLIHKLGREPFEIIPGVSAMQLAFAKIKESWDDAVLTSVHARPMEGIVDLVRANRKIGIFTDDKHTPAAVAQALLAHGVDGYRAYVGENLGGAEERITETDLRGLVRQKFAPLNTLILIREKPAPTPARPWTLGIPDEEFYQRKPLKGLITKSEVRVIALAKMRLKEDSIAWDIGAGAGSVSVEAALIAKKGQVYAIEKSAEDVAIVKKNIAKFGVGNVWVAHGLAPEGLDRWPDPDAVFVGGSGGRMEAILDAACRRLRPQGRIVVDAATWENLSEAVRVLRGKGWATEITMVSVARSKEVVGLTRWEALNPVFIVASQRESPARPGQEEEPE